MTRTKIKTRIATLNVRGIQTDLGKNQLIEDASNYNIPVMTISETHIAEEEYIEDLTYRSKDGIKKYTLYSVNEESNSYHGVGFLIEKNLNPSFQRISERVAKATIEIGNRRLIIIAIYAPTLTVSEKNPEARELFYETINSEIAKTANRDILFVAGDFNAKIGSLNKKYPEYIGKYGKGYENSSGKHLLELCIQNDMYAINTTFAHKLSHRTTWTAPMRNYTTKDGSERRNPIRNQIDFILTRRNIKSHILNARSYNGLSSDTDHKLVIADILLKPNEIHKGKKKKQQHIKIYNIQTKDNQLKYKESMIEINIPQELSQQGKWDELVKTCKTIGEKILGRRDQTVKHDDEKLKELTDEKRKLKMDKNIEKDKQKRVKLGKLRKDIRNRIREIEEQQLNIKLEAIENTKNDSNRYFRAMRELQNEKKKEKIFVKDDKKRIAGSDTKTVELITDYFKEMLSPENFNIKQYPPAEMRIPFTGEEIQKAAKGIKNGKSAGSDDLHPELIKYAPISTHQTIAEIYNETAKSGEHPKELELGILAPIHKPGKPKGERKNLRPIMLLSILRKLLTICIINRIWDRLSPKIPKEQSAYQAGRSTSEQVLTIKLMAERAINSKDLHLYLALFDMSKAFDTVDRKKLLNYLEEVLYPDELHLIHVLTNAPKVRVRTNGVSGEEFTTHVGVMQGDCLSAIMFIFYLSMALKEEEKQMNTNSSLLLKPKYADDITYITASIETYQNIQQKLPDILKEDNLEINHTKTELYEIPKPPPPPPPQPTIEEKIKHKNDKPLWSELDWLVNYKAPIPEDKTPDWKSCKLLGSYIGTNKDIENRKNLTLQTFKKFDKIFKSNVISRNQKIRTFNIYIACIFLYNSETWSLTKSTEEQINAFQRRLLRYAINIQWPKKISNEKLNNITKAEPWSKTIRRRRLKFLGHITRLHPDTPVKIALREAFKPIINKRGRPNNTWIHTIADDLKHINIEIKLNDPNSLTKITNLTEDRKNWKKLVHEALM